MAKKCHRIHPVVPRCGQGAAAVANEIFISYRRSDEPKARLLYNLLKERGVEAWYDAKIGAGEEWRTTTANALDKAPIFVLLMSKNASESGDIAKELAAATHKRKLVVPVRLDDMQLEGMFLYELASRNWINAYHNTEKRLAELSDKLAELVKAGLTDEAAAALEVNMEGGAPQAVIADARPKRAAGQRSGSVALITAAAVAVLAAGGAGAWFVTSNAKPKQTLDLADAAPAAAANTATEAKGTMLVGALNDLASDAKAAERSDKEVAALTEASQKLAAMSTTAAASGDAAAEMTNVALEAVRKHIDGLESDPAVTAVKSDLKAVQAEFKSARIKSDPDLAKLIEEIGVAQAALKAANDAAAGTDIAAATAAVEPATAAVKQLVALRPKVGEAFVKAKRLAFKTNADAAKAIGAEIATLAAAKKPNVFASSERKEAHKYLVEMGAWSQSKMAEIDQLSSGIASADRKAATSLASKAAGIRNEMNGQLANAKAAAARLAAN